MTNPTNVMPTQPASSIYSTNLSIYFPKIVGYRGQPCLTPMLQLISSHQPSLFLNLLITSHKLENALTMLISCRAPSSTMLQWFNQNTASIVQPLMFEAIMKTSYSSC